LIIEWLFAVFAIALILVVLITVLLRASAKRIMQTAMNEAQLKVNHKQELANNSLLVQEQERTRIAEDIHDSLINTLLAARLLNDTNDRKKLDTILEKSIHDARRISHDLSPPMIDETPIYELLSDVISPFESRFSISRFYSEHASDVLSSATKIQVIRILQEWITNITKHSHSSSITFQLRIEHTYVALCISDFGVGFSPNNSKKGLGLTSIALRAAFISSHFRMYSTTGKGSRLFLLIPQYNIS